MDELRRIRKERGLSQQRLADLANVDKVTIVHIEGGKVSPKVETLEKLAAALKVDLADLFPKSQAPLFVELPDPATQEERRALWEDAVDRALRLRETGRDRLAELLAAWRASKARGEDSDARRGYREKMGELLQEAYDGETALLEALSVSGELLGPDELSEVQAARSFYDGLWHLIQGAGLNIRTDDAQPQEYAQPGQPESHTVEEVPEAA
jgi:transcriptional regulator with XRE-family HTH domain